MAHRVLTNSEPPPIDTGKPPWHVLSGDEVERLRRDALLLSRARGETFFRQGEAAHGLYCVIVGDVLLEQYDDQGSCIAFHIASPGMLFGYRSLFGHEPHATNAQALRASRVALLPGATVQALLASNRELAGELLSVLARDPGPLHAPLLRSPLVPAIVRLTHLLLILKDRYARPWREHELYYELPLSQEQIGALIGVRRESVSRLFRQLDAAGVCAQRGRKIIVPVVERLIEYVGLHKEAEMESAVSSAGPSPQ